MDPREQEIEDAIKESKRSSTRFHLAVLVVIAAVIIFCFLVFGSGLLTSTERINNPSQAPDLNNPSQSPASLNNPQQVSEPPLTVTAPEPTNPQHVPSPETGHVNMPPTAYNKSLSANKNIPVQIALTGSDIDGTINSCNIYANPAHGILSGAGCSKIYTPNNNFTGSDTFRYYVMDNESANSSVATVIINVSATNASPVASSDLATLTENSSSNSINVLSNDTDSDGNTITIISVTQGAHGSVAIINSGAALSYTPNSGFFGADSFSYTISDGNGGTATSIVSVNITHPNPCSGVSCTSPPASTCINSSTLRTYNSPGSCSSGSCSYSNTDTNCQFGCSNGRCNNDTCAGVSCTTPSSNTCSGTNKITYNSPGSCSGGSCSYSSSSSACPSTGCSGTTLQTGGTCSAGSCTFTSSQNCAASNACVNSGVAYQTCSNSNTAVTRQDRIFNSYTCSGNACSLASSAASSGCTAVDTNAVTCSQPSPTCVSSTLLRTYTSACSSGSCVNTSTDSACPAGQVCSNGQCKTGPAKEFNVTASRFSFDPSTITVNKNDQVILRIVTIVVTHGFSITAYNIIEVLPPGETKTINFTADQPGQFNFFCSVFCGSGHSSMTGTLIVNP